MTVRQYISARYMPKFSEHNSGDWDNTYTYEALEIVKYGNDYYTAKKAVPTGWEDITFGTTGYDDFPAGVDYDHLTLTY